MFAQKNTDGRFKILIAPPHFCTDNAAMIASSAFFGARYGKRNLSSLKIQPQMHIPAFSGRIPAFRA
jgi:tRNA A37 threonylcarbamoyltransferase TsaD